MKHTPMQFDFRTCWPLVQAVISRPEIQAILDAELARYDRQHRRSARYRDRSLPWTYARDGYWHEVADQEADLGGHYNEAWCHLGYTSPEALDAVLEAEQDLDDQPETERWFHHLQEVASQFLPRPGTPEHYMAFGACHWLVAWEVAIGQVLFPDLNWRAVRGPEHSTAAGFLPGSGYSVPVVVFDILREDQNPLHTLQDARRRRPRKTPRRESQQRDWSLITVVTDCDDDLGVAA